MISSVPDNFQSQGVNEELRGVNRHGSLKISLPFILLGQEASFPQVFELRPLLSETLDFINRLKCYNVHFAQYNK